MSTFPEQTTLTAQERREVFLRATRCFATWYKEQIERGMTDAELEAALAKALGVGGSGGPNMLSVSHNGAGLRIWGGWEHPNVVQDAPLFAGRVTLMMAREVYVIKDPDAAQMALF